MSQNKDLMLMKRGIFTGKIIIGKKKIPITLTVSAGQSGKLELEVDPMHSIEDYCEVVRTAGKIGETFNYFKLECEGENEQHLKSDAAYLTAHNLPQKAGEAPVGHIKIDTSKTSITMNLSEQCEGTQLGFRLLNFNCCPGGMSSKTDLGKIFVSPNVRKLKGNEVTGYICIESTKVSGNIDWKMEARELLQRLRTLLAFVRGMPLYVPIEEFYQGNHCEATFHSVNYGNQQSLLLPCIRYLSLNSFFEKAAPAAREIDAHNWNILGIMINLSLVPTTYREVCFLTQMIAIESFAIGYFQWSKPEKIPLEDKIKSLLKALNIKQEQLNIKYLTEIRNQIAHQGIAKKRECLGSSIIMAREVLVRIVFAMIKFEGDYDCYIGKHQC
ncbi:MAG: hypothetical protein OYH77_05175 [Pseudomonadota bacterium]|nr:hypothetical protein [Pseudomonadota bacterium]